MSRVVILDFDGTMTDAEAEGRPFRDGYLLDLALLADRPLAEVTALADRIEADVLAAPQAYGWNWNGHVVCPATVDPYQRIGPVSRGILDHYGVVTDPQERFELLEGTLFRQNYRKTITAFRPHAAEVLAGLRGHETWVVTNAHADHVKAKIANLSAQVDGGLGWLVDRVRGLARKQVVDMDDPRVADIPREIFLPGLPRPVLPRRPHYRELLDELRAGRPWDQVTVVGDIFELDLSLPLLLGARVVLAGHPFTPPWEKAHVQAHPKARWIEDLRDLAAALAD
jgi:phosphoglycolate phosphatase-like HAD superfamily hydrolase